MYPEDTTNVPGRAVVEVIIKYSAVGGNEQWEIGA